MVEHQPSKLDTRVRFPSPAPRVLGLVKSGIATFLQRECCTFAYIGVQIHSCPFLKTKKNKAPRSSSLLGAFQFLVLSDRFDSLFSQLSGQVFAGLGAQVRAQLIQQFHSLIVARAAPAAGVYEFGVCLPEKLLIYFGFALLLRKGQLILPVGAARVSEACIGVSSS